MALQCIRMTKDTCVRVSVKSELFFTIRMVFTPEEEILRFRNFKN